MSDIFLNTVLTLDASVRVCIPLIFASMAGLFAERSGVVDIGLEGKLLMSAFIAASAAVAFGSPWIGFLAGITPTLKNDQRFLSIDLPGIELMDHVPILGVIYRELISGHNILVYLAFAIVPMVWWVVFKTRFGLRLRAVGENPKAVDTAGISVESLRYKALLIGGILCGIGGVYLSTAYNAQFVKDMTAGSGFIALAALIFGKWHPYKVLAACFLFAFLDAISIRLQGIIIPGIGEIPVQLIEATPYILTIILLAGFIGKAVPPKASAQPYIKEL